MVKLKKRNVFELFCRNSVGQSKAEIAEKRKKSVEHAATAVLDCTLNGIFGLLCRLVRAEKDFAGTAEKNDADFFCGTEKFLCEPEENSAWLIGYSSVSLVPEDVLNGKYYLGGFLMAENGFKNRIERVVDDMRARVIAVDDYSKRGTSLFATVDCIGMTNKSIREIRRLASAMISEKHPEAKLASINVCSTHAHSCIDTQGLWSNMLPKLIKNGMRGLLGKKMESGADENYLALICGRIAAAMAEAYDDMKPGTMTYAEKELDPRYFSNKNRQTATSLDTKFRRLLFKPNDGSRSTMIVNFGAHPDIAGLPTSDGQGDGRSLSGDYVFYMSETVENAGYNLMFFNGAICGIYAARSLTNDNQPMTERWQQSQRYGIEMGKTALSLTKSREEIESDAVLYDETKIKEETEKAGGEDKYTLWCKNWESVTETQVEPFFNIRTDKVEISVTNPLIRMAGKLRLANNDVHKKCGELSVSTEIGVLEFGSVLRVAMVPGEFCTDLAFGGGSLTEAGSFLRQPFEAHTLRDIYGVTAVFGLANDAIGYIVPDNDYAMAGAFGHYQETISLGAHTASTIMRAFDNQAKLVLKQKANSQA